MKNLVRILISSFILVMVLSACSDNTEEASQNTNETEAEDKIVLRVSSGLPDVHSWFSVYFTPWMEQIEEETNGLVEFEVFPGESLVPIEGEVDALESGTIDIALPIFPIYETSRFPLSEVTMLPITEIDPEIATKAYHQLVTSDTVIADDKSYLEYDFGEHNLKLFSVPPLPPYVLSGVSNEFNSLESFKGALIRSSGPAHELLVDNLGGSPTTIGASDLTEAVSRGTVDGNMQAIADWKSYGFDEILKHTIEGVHFGTFTTLIGMTNEKWNSLPDDVQEVIEDATNDLQVPGATKLIELGDEIRNDYLDNGGVFTDISDLDSDVEEHILESVEKTWHDWIDRLDSKGHPGKEIAVLWRDLIIENGGDVPSEIKNIN